MEKKWNIYIFGCVSKILVDSSYRVGILTWKSLLIKAYFIDFIQTFTYKKLAKTIYIFVWNWCISNLPLLTPNQKIRTLFYVELWTLLLSSIRSSMTATFFVVVVVIVKEEWRCLQFYYSSDHKSVQLIMQIFDRS